MTIYEALRDDHDTQRTLVEQLLETQGDSDGRNELYARLKRELVAHAAAEERCFYVPLMEDDLTQEQARHSVAEHHELDEYLEQLDEYDMSGPHWIRTANDLAERLRHHLAEEEHEVFQQAGKVLDDDRARELADEYASEMERHRAEL